MARYSKTLTPAAMAAFVAALEGGALVEAAAAQAGVALSTLYWRRGRDARLAAAWDEAVAKSRYQLRAAPGQAAKLAKRRRIRFDAGRRARFLEWLDRTCHTTEAADAAGVHRSAVYRRIARDREFARACRAALERGYARLEGLLAQERREKTAQWPRPIVATGTPTEDFEEALRLMRRWERPKPRPRRDGIVPRRRPSFDEEMAALERKLRFMDVPPAAGGGDA